MGSAHTRTKTDMEYSILSFRGATSVATWEFSVAKFGITTTRTKCEYHFLRRQKISLLRSNNITLALREYHLRKAQTAIIDVFNNRQRKTK